MSSNDACIICLETSPPPNQSGCACRGDGGLAHIDCRIRAAASQQAQRGDEVWWQCQTCKHDFTGAMRTGLAVSWRSRVAGQAPESSERLGAECNLAQALIGQGKYAQAEPMLLELRRVEMRVLGFLHPKTLATNVNLASALSYQGKNAEAERIERDVLAVQMRVLGAEHPETLTTMSNLALSISGQGKDAEAEQIQRELLEVQKRVLGAEHPETLKTASNLAASLGDQCKFATAAAIQRELLGVQTRVLGEEHPDKLTTASNLAVSLSGQGRLAEAEQMLEDVVASRKRVLGPSHPATLHAASILGNMLEQIRSTRPTNAAAPTVAAPALPLPAGSGSTRATTARWLSRVQFSQCDRFLQRTVGQKWMVTGLKQKADLDSESVPAASCQA